MAISVTDPARWARTRDPAAVLDRDDLHAPARSGGARVEALGQHDPRHGALARKLDVADAVGHERRRPADVRGLRLEALCRPGPERLPLRGSRSRSTTPPHAVHAVSEREAQWRPHDAAAPAREPRLAVDLVERGRPRSERLPLELDAGLLAIPRAAGDAGIAKVGLLHLERLRARQLRERTRRSAAPSGWASAGEVLDRARPGRASAPSSSTTTTLTSSSPADSSSRDC